MHYNRESLENPKGSLSRVCKMFLVKAKEEPRTTLVST
jgi:hypothetical protein